MEQMKKIKGKCLYTPKGAAREYGRIGCNFYTGCPHGCEYCYLKRGITRKALGGTEVRLKECFKDEADAARQIVKEFDRWIEPCRKYGVFLSFTTDPMIPETRGLTLKTILEAVMRDIPVYILTKDATFINDECDFMAWMESISLESRALVHFGFTLTGFDNMEPNASPNKDRRTAMRLMHAMGFPTFASIEPVIEWRHSAMAVSLLRDCCDHYKIGLRSGVRKDYYDSAKAGAFIRYMVEKIVAAGRTVYLKESTRKLLLGCLSDTEYKRIMGFTQDMDGHPYPTPALTKEEQDVIRHGWFATTSNIRRVLDKPHDAMFSVGQFIAYEDHVYEIIGYYDYFGRLPHFLAVDMLCGYPVGLPFTVMDKMRPIEPGKPSVSITTSPSTNHKTTRQWNRH